MATSPVKRVLPVPSTMVPLRMIRSNASMIMCSSSRGRRFHIATDLSSPSQADRSSIRTVIVPAMARGCRCDRAKEHGEDRFELAATVQRAAPRKGAVSAAMTPAYFVTLAMVV